MNNILDNDPPLSPPQKPYFAYAATTFGFITIVLMIFASTIIPEKISIGAMFAFPEWLTKSIKISFILGVVFIILSFIWKEKTKAKWVGVLSNIFALVIIIALILYYRKLAGGF